MHRNIIKLIANCLHNLHTYKFYVNFYIWYSVVFRPNIFMELINLKNTLKSLWADLIFKARNIHQMSQIELAEELQAKGHNVDNTLISGIENDCRMPGPEIREDLLDILNVSGRVGYEANLEVWDLSREDNKKEKIDIESFVDISPH